MPSCVNRIRGLVHRSQVPFPARPLVLLGLPPLARMATPAFPHTKYAARSVLHPSIFPRWHRSPLLCRKFSVETL
jgi:hypothetical protein